MNRITDAEYMDYEPDLVFSVIFKPDTEKCHISVLVLTSLGEEKDNIKGIE